MKKNTTVLVVGGGPCGLAAACQLLARGIDVRVIEAAVEPTAGSRAILLWPPTLEILREIGVLEEALTLGFKAQALNYHLTGGRAIRVGLGERNQPLMLQQDRTNRLLEDALERLGGKVERGMRVTGVRPGEQSVEVEVETTGGRELITGDWLIGADGVGSAVRQGLGIEFEGAPIPSTFILAEGGMQGDYDRGELHYLFGVRGALVFAPLPGDVVRVSAPIAPDTPLTPQTIQRLLDERGPGGLRMSGLGPVTSFTSQERIAATLRQGRCFLVGDAAHTHSPIGGQGLNLGLQDVGNLVWKLAGVIEGRLAPALLDSYDVERRHAAAEVVRLTGMLTRLATLRPAAARVRNVVWSLLQRAGILRRWYAPLLAGWKAGYPTPYEGGRAPSWAAGPDLGSFRLVTTGDLDRALVTEAREFSGRWAGLVSHEHVSRRGGGFLLVRPDGYVAARGVKVADLASAGRVLERVTVR